MSPFLESKKETYRAHRLASQGADITLVVGISHYLAQFDCAAKIAAVLGKDGLESLVEGLDYTIPCYRIPMDKMISACQKLSAHHSIALVDYFTDLMLGGRFVAVWCIEKTGAALAQVEASTNLDEY